MINSKSADVSQIKSKSSCSQNHTDACVAGNVRRRCRSSIVSDVNSGANVVLAAGLLPVQVQMANFTPGAAVWQEGHL